MASRWLKTEYAGHGLSEGGLPKGYGEGRCRSFLSEVAIPAKGKASARSFLFRSDRSPHVMPVPKRRPEHITTAHEPPADH